MIDKNIPIPVGRSGSLTSKLRELQIGDSMLIEKYQQKSVYELAKRAGVKVTTRAEGEKVRVWRIASVPTIEEMSELNAIQRPLVNCDHKCKSRGISINKHAENNAAIKAIYERIPFLSPQFPYSVKFVCRFHFVGEAGKIWNTAGNRPDLHHTLLKCDEFAAEKCINIVGLIPLEDF